MIIPINKRHYNHNTEASNQLADAVVVHHQSTSRVWNSSINMFFHPSKCTASDNRWNDTFAIRADLSKTSETSQSDGLSRHSGFQLTWPPKKTLGRSWVALPICWGVPTADPCIVVMFSVGTFHLVMVDQLLSVVMCHGHSFSPKPCPSSNELQSQII
jgi:hypothetical protein